MKNSILATGVAIALLSCAGVKTVPDNTKTLLPGQEGFVHFFKVQVFCAALEHSYQNKEIMRLIEQEDLAGSYDGLAIEKVHITIDSIGRKVAETIKPEEYADFNNKKRIIEKCLLYYNSKELDSIARSQCFKYINY
jgi:hypothetical protein